MRTIGLLLLLAGFFGASFISVRRLDRDTKTSPRLDWQSIAWYPYSAFLAVGVVGVVILRSTASRAAGAEARVSANMAALRSSLARIGERLETLRTERGTLGVYGIAPRIELDLNEEFAQFADARETMVPVFGIQTYADVMSDFAAAERAVNRAWCASSDGYVDEAWLCIDRAAALIRMTAEKFNRRDDSVPAPMASAERTVR